MRTSLSDFISVKAWRAKRKSDTAFDKLSASYWEGYIEALRQAAEEMERLIKEGEDVL